MSVCALEANINEHFMQKNGILKNFDYDQRISIFRETEKFRILDKYQFGPLLALTFYLVFLNTSISVGRYRYKISSNFDELRLSIAKYWVK